VLRFQWPSIGRGWERGLISFGRAIQSSDDVELLRQVSDLADTTVVIVYGTKDNVVKIDDAVLQKLKRNHPTIKILRMEGLGHDPFEEDKETFLSELEKVLYVNTADSS
jgi:pimeloyl-ACP methyl ester carboxylesterase